MCADRQGLRFRREFSHAVGRRSHDRVWDPCTAGRRRLLILRAVRESGGFAIAVPDDEIEVAVNEVAKQDGLLLCPEGSATDGGLQASTRGWPRSAR